MSFIIEDGVLIKYNGADADVVIPDEVKKISRDAFAYTPITSVKIHGNIEAIDRAAFCELKRLKRIYLEDLNIIMDEGLLWPMGFPPPEIYVKGTLAENITIPKGVKK